MVLLKNDLHLFLNHDDSLVQLPRGKSSVWLLDSELMFCELCFKNIVESMVLQSLKLCFPGLGSIDHKVEVCS